MGATARASLLKDAIRVADAPDFWSDDGSDEGFPSGEARERLFETIERAWYADQDPVFAMLGELAMSHAEELALPEFPQELRAPHR